MRDSAQIPVEKRNPMFVQEPY